MSGVCAAHSAGSTCKESDAIRHVCAPLELIPRPTARVMESDAVPGGFHDDVEFSHDRACGRSALQGRLPRRAGGAVLGLLSPLVRWRSVTTSWSAAYPRLRATWSPSTRTAWTPDAGAGPLSRTDSPVAVTRWNSSYEQQCAVLPSTLRAQQSTISGSPSRHRMGRPSRRRSPRRTGPTLGCPGRPVTTPRRRSRPESLPWGWSGTPPRRLRCLRCEAGHPRSTRSPRQHHHGVETRRSAHCPAVVERRTGPWRWESTEPEQPLERPCGTRRASAPHPHYRSTRPRRHRQGQRRRHVACDSGADRRGTEVPDQAQRNHRQGERSQPLIKLPRVALLRSHPRV